MSGYLGGDDLKLRLLSGLAATGKSTVCYEEICEHLSGTNDLLFLVVPSYLIHDAEEAILSRVGGYDRLKVVTLPQLAGWILRQEGADRRIIGSIERHMLLQSVLRESKNSLQVLGEAAKRHRFAEIVANTIASIQHHGVSAAQFADLIKQQGVPDPKLGDLALLACRYAERLGDRDDRESLLLRAVALLRNTDHAPRKAGVDSVSWKHIKVWIDGYLWLSPLEQEFVVRLAQRIAQVTLTCLCIPSEQNGKYRSLAKAKSFADGIKREAKRLGIPVEEKVLDANQHLPIALAKIASSFLDEITSPVSGKNSVSIVQYPDETAEILWTCARILCLIRDHQVRWRDIVVIVGDPGNYRKELVHRFWQCGIPHNWCATDGATVHPLIRLLLQLVEVIDTNLAFHSVIQLIKSPLWPGADAEKDILEQEARKFGVDGEMWITDSAWAGNKLLLSSPDEDSDGVAENTNSVLDLLRTKILGPLKSFWESVVQGTCGEDFLRAFWETVSILELEQAFANGDLAAQEAQVGYENLIRVSFDKYVWQQLIAVFDFLHEELGDKDITWDEFSSFWKGGLEQIRLSQDSESLDAVRIVSVQQAAGISAPYVFVIGCIDGVFARTHEESVLLVSGELQQVERLVSGRFPGLQHQQVNGEDQLSYVALTRATKQLWVSWPRMVWGRQAYPHASIDALCRLFSDVSVQEEDVLPVELWSHHHLAGISIARWIDRGTQFIPQDVVDVYNWLCSSQAGRLALAKYIAGTTYTGINSINSGLSSNVARKLYKQPFVTSVSQLETFASCPFSHFLKYGLRLRPMQEYTLEITDYGNLVHAGLRDFFRFRQSVEGKIDRQLLESWVNDFLAKWTEEINGGIFSATERHRHFSQRIKNRLLDALEVLLEEEARSQFRQVAAELEFGIGSELGTVALQLDDGTDVWLRGKIDRVDVCEKDGKVWARVWDYKLGYKGFDLVLVREGLSLQLLAYLMALVDKNVGGKKVFPAAVQYFRVPDIFLTSQCGPLDDAVHQKNHEKSYQVAGLFIDDKDVLSMIDCEIGSRELYPIKFKKKTGEFYESCQDRVASEAEWEEILWFVRGKIAKLAEQILNGCITMLPYRYGNDCACDMCDYRDVCLFDPAAESFQYRVINKSGRNVSKKAELLAVARAMGGKARA